LLFVSPNLQQSPGPNETPCCLVDQHVLIEKQAHRRDGVRKLLQGEEAGAGSSCDDGEDSCCAIATPQLQYGTPTTDFEIWVIEEFNFKSINTKLDLPGRH
jgi:hypothetical protein